MQEGDARERVGGLLESVRDHEMPGGAHITLSAGLACFPRDGRDVGDALPGGQPGDASREVGGA